MAVRVTATEVKSILETETTLTDAQVTAIIVSANVMVDTVLGTGTTTILKEIERWLSAHMVAISKERQALKEEAGGAAITYTGAYGLGLKSTSYGQMVLTLDTSGAFADLGIKSASLKAITSFDD
jgi:hypothetical protein